MNNIKSNIKSKQFGFTLIEFLVVLSLSSILVAFANQALISKRIVDKIKQDSDIAAVEIVQIQQAASGYLVDEGEWPDSTNACAGAITPLINATPTAYLRAPLLALAIQSPYLTNYATECTSRTFVVTTTTGRYETQEEAKNIARILKHKLGLATQNLIDESDGTYSANVRSSVPRPVNQPTLERFLLLDGSRAMKGDLDLGGNAITKVSDISVGKLGDGRTIVDVRTIQIDSGPNHHSTYPVPKPSCPSGKKPALNLALVGIVLDNNKQPFIYPPFIINGDDVEAFNWDIQLNVFDEDGRSTATATGGGGAFVQTTISCVKNAGNS